MNFIRFYCIVREISLLFSLERLVLRLAIVVVVSPHGHQLQSVHRGDGDVDAPERDGGGAEAPGVHLENWEMFKIKSFLGAHLGNSAPALPLASVPQSCPGRRTRCRALKYFGLVFCF